MHRLCGRVAGRASALYRCDRRSTGLRRSAGCRERNPEHRLRTPRPQSESTGILARPSHATCGSFYRVFDITESLCGCNNPRGNPGSASPLRKCYRMSLRPTNRTKMAADAAVLDRPVQHWNPCRGSVWPEDVFAMAADIVKRVSVE